MDSVINRVENILKSFKSAENASGVKFVQGDDVAVKILSIWPELSVSMSEPLAFGGPPEHKANLWKYVWKFRRIEYHDIEKKTGIEDRKLIQEKLNLLVTHQLIYPDGSISQAAQSFLNSR